MTISANVVDYDQVTASYESGLNTQLRGFRGGARFLEHWVHDPDPVKSIVNMIEAAETAGLPDVTVVLGPRAQAAVEMARLDKLAAELGQVAKEERAAGLALTVRFTRAAAPVAGLGAEARDRARRAREARDARLSAQAQAAPRRAPRDGLHPAYRRAASRILETPLTHEGALDAAPGLERLEVVHDGWTLIALVDPATHRVRAVRHRNAREDTRALLEALCATMEDQPLLECADHAVIRLEHRLRDRGQPRPVAGVVTPESVDPTFASLTAAVRELLVEYRRRTRYAETDNRFDPEPAAAWRTLDPEQRVARVQAGLDHLAAGHGLRPGDVACTRIDRNTRATVAFRAELPAQQKARLMMALERGLKDTVEGTLHLYQEEMHDKNKIRRL
ncbi:MAG TPA: hypothetical protein VLK35_21150 [Methylomirabilota bacterium]|nr:hypothetical protein [Methylomirabilota bacterium]